MQNILNDAEADTILTTTAFHELLKPLLAAAPGFQNIRWLYTESLAEGLEDNWREPNLSSDSLALLQYTSGTTDSPKGVMLTHHNVLHNLKIIGYCSVNTPQTRVLTWIPTYHNAGLVSAVIHPLYVGYESIVMSPVSFLQSPPRWLRAIGKHQISLSGGPNFAYDLCVRHATPQLLESLDLSGWETAFTGAEQTRPETLDRFAETFGRCGFRREAFFASYGLTESTLMVSGRPKSSDLIIKTLLASGVESNRVVDAAPDDQQTRSFVSCGEVLPDQEAIFVNPDTLDPCEASQIGELWLKSGCVSQGYWKRPAETAATFHARLAKTGEGPFLRTGDLGFMADRNLFITGRIKELIIIRGRNHYPQDIEASVAPCHPAIRPGGGAAFSIEIDDEERLVVVQEVNQSEDVQLDTLIELIRQAIAQSHGIQVYAVQLVAEGTIPRTTSNKIQRRACRAGFLAGRIEFLAAWQGDISSQSQASAVPQSVILDTAEAIEAWLAGLISSRLGGKSGRIDESLPLINFGLDSLGSIELAHAIEANCQVTVPMWILLQGPSIRRLAAHIIDEQKNNSRSPRPVVASAENAPNEYPLSRGQQALWFLHQMAPESTAYNIASAVRIDAELDVPALSRSFEIITGRHAQLRTTFTALRGEPRQQVHERIDLLIQEEDATTWNEEFLKDRLTELANRPFDLAQGPLLRLFLFRKSASSHVLLSVMHHIITDLWSLAVLLDELRVVYQAQTNGKGATLAPVTLMYSDFVRWQEEMLDSAEGERLWAFWGRQLGGELPALNLLADHPRPPVQTYRGASHSFELDAEITARLKSVAQENGATLYMTLLAAFQLLLHRYTGQEDIPVGSVTAGRSQSGMAGMVGYLVNPLVLRAHFSPGETFADLLGQVRQTVLEAFAHEDYPFTLLVERLLPERDPSRSPLFQVMFILQKAPLLDEEGLASFALGQPGVQLKLGDLTLESLGLEQRAAQFDLTLMMAETERGVTGSFEYNTDLFDSTTIDRLALNFQTLLDSIVTNPHCSVAALPLLGDAELRLLAAWNRTGAEYNAQAYLHQLFEAQAERTPDNPAVVFEDKQLSYRELNRRANQLANYLRGKGIGPEVLVGVFSERSIEMVVALLGVLKAGGAYLPLDPGYPTERLTFMLEDAQAPVVLTQRRLAENIRAQAQTVIRLDADWELIAKESEENPVNQTTAENLAYVIYTSGSTGRPKGTMNTHRGLCNRLHWMQEAYHLTAADRILQKTPFSFDVSVWEFFWPLITGATLVVAEPGGHLDTGYLIRTICESRITTMHFVPSMLSVFLEDRDVEKCHTLRQVISSGEALSFDLQERFFDRLPAKLHNLYGPTEASIDVTYWQCRPRHDQQGVPIGHSIANTQIHILDHDLRRVPVGVAGELSIGGVGVGRGYLNRPGLTAEKFLPDPFSERAGGCLYRTGDLARYRADGAIEYLGRIDQQVKIRGFRIETEEIEAVLNQHPSVRESVVVARESSITGKYLIAYVVADSRPDGSFAELRSFLKKKLPEYMIPGTFVSLEDLPLTPNGKVDRRALPAPDAEPETERQLAAPRTPIEEIVAGIWARVLGLAQVGIHEDFFGLGGHSLLATQVISRVREALRVELPVRTIFESPNVAKLAQEIVKAQGAEQSSPLPSLQRAPRDAEIALSYAQRRLWFLSQLETDFHPYNMPGAVRLTGPLNVELLAWSLNEVVRRHEILRTTFALRRDQPWQIIAPTLNISFPVTDLRDLSETAREDAVQSIIADESQRSFDLVAGPLFRAHLLRLAAEDHVMVLTMHHIISDGWSIGVLVRNLTSLYRSSVEDTDSTLEPLPIQYADFALWQQQCIQGEAIQAQLAYWRGQLENSPPLLELPIDYPRPPIQSFRGASLPLDLSESLSNALRVLARQEGATLFMTLLAAFAALLSRYTGQEDIAIGTPIAGRTQIELESLIGCFVNTLVLRTDLTGEPTFIDLLGRVRETALAAYAHQDLPFEKLVEELQPERNLNRTPLFQVMFVMQNAAIEELRLPDLELTPLKITHQTAKFDLTLSLEETAQGLCGSFQYNTDIFASETIARMAAHFRTLLQGIVENPTQPLSSLPLLTEKEEDLLLVRRNDTFTEYPVQSCVHRLFEKQAERTPDEVAIVLGDERVTYRDLNTRANKVGNYLRTKGITAEVPVGIMMKRSVDMVIGLLGVLKAGGAYVPLEPASPQERIASILAEAQVAVVLTQEDLLEKLTGQGAPLVCLQRDWGLIDQHSVTNLPDAARPDNLAYVIYTSGSTGRPKGVAVAHRQLCNYVQSIIERLDLPSAANFALVSTLAADLGYTMLFPSLCAGARLHILSEEQIADPDAVADYFSRWNIDCLKIVPSHLKALLAVSRPEQVIPRRRLILGGEASDWNLVEKLQALAPDCSIYNHYGPTESTVGVLTYPVNQLSRHLSVSLPLGRPIANCQVYVLDKHLRPVPIGVAGELYVGGEPLARGYLNRPDLTAESFIPNPFGSAPGMRLYKTGDLTRYLPSGDIEFLGRIDYQVKIRGFRVELGEIETALERHPNVHESVVTTVEGPVGDKQLLGYVILRQESASTAEELRSFLKERLPHFMVPKAIVPMKEWPLTPNGKINRQLLPKPDRSRPEFATGYVAPRNADEKTLAAIWTDLLGFEVGVHDNFFESGGHSLLATQLISRVRAAFQLELPLRTIFESPSIAALATHIETIRWATEGLAESTAAGQGLEIGEL